LTVSCVDDDGRIAAVSLPVPDGLAWVVLVPATTASTAEARAVLPRSVPLRDAVFNVQRVALLLAGLQARRPDALVAALEDRLHQPYRRAVFPWMPSVAECARRAPVAYQLRASFLPYRESVRERLEGTANNDLVIDRVPLEGGATLQRGSVYLVPLLESLALPPDVRGRSNPKSTTGRLDVFT